MKRGLVAGLLATALTLAGAAETSLTPAEHRRGEEQTYLSFPEWYLVHSPAELALFLSTQRAPSEFPWAGQLAQFWRSYGVVTRETRGLPFNGGYHLMVSVIGASTSLEYGLRAAYEATVGRLAEASSDGAMTAEERLAARVAQAYADFIVVEPWYRFDFVAALRELWLATPALGPNLLRKWERRFALSTEYAAKALYAWLIGLGTQSIFDAPRPLTAIVLDRAPGPLPPSLRELRRLPVDGGAVVVTVPRYRAFMDYAQALAEQGLVFREIAGNRGSIVVSLIERSPVAPPAAPLRLLFVQPLLTRPGWERRVVAVPVSELAAQLHRWRVTEQRLEHVYDY